MGNQRKRILVISHRHPDFSLGGGEIAAYNLYKAYKSHPDVEDAWFLASIDRGNGASGVISPRRRDEYLWEQTISDWFMLKAANRLSLMRKFVELVKALKPNVVHAHHYAHLGIEFLRIVKSIDPSIKVILTLHEYMAICNNSGQMIKTNGRLCSNESYDDCRNCFPDRSVQDFWRRKHFIIGHFNYVDYFFSPSQFLKDRYVKWGIPEEKIMVIENGQDESNVLPPREIAENEARNRFGYFGQINPFKGLKVLLKALHDLPKKERKKIVLEVHGANLEMQKGEFQQEIKSLAEPLIEQGVVYWMGPYEPQDVRKRMAGVDWVVMPSIWWENSPMVIQESFVAGRPLLVSDIGGMAEKVAHGVNGLHVCSGSTLEWGKAFLRAQRLEIWEEMRSGIKAPLTHAQVADKHIEVINFIR